MDQWRCFVTEQLVDYRQLCEFYLYKQLYRLELAKGRRHMDDLLICRTETIQQKKNRGKHQAHRKINYESYESKLISSIQSKPFKLQSIRSELIFSDWVYFQSYFYLFIYSFYYCSNQSVSFGKSTCFDTQQSGSFCVSVRPSVSKICIVRHQ